MESGKKKRRSGCVLTVLLGMIILTGMIGYVLLNTPMLSPTIATATLMPISISTTFTPSGELTIAQQLAQIDDALRQTLLASIAYNAPQAMDLDETVTIELLLNPSVLTGDLATQVTEPGHVVTAEIQVTPKMKAELTSRDPDAFIIKPLQDSPDQFISGSETTRWGWDVTAKKGGQQRLTLIIHRLVTVDGESNWRPVETYRSDIEVNVSIIQRLMMLDWKWLAGIVITALLIPSFWRFMDGRSKKRKKRSK